MPNMRRREEQVVAADHRLAAAFDRATIDRHLLAKRVAVAYYELDVLAVKTQILRIAADRAERMKNVVAPDLRRPRNDRVRVQNAAVAQFDIVANHSVRPDLQARPKLRRRRDRSLHMNMRDAHAFGCSAFGASVFAFASAGFGSRSTILHISVASAHKLPSTVARPSSLAKSPPRQFTTLISSFN